MIKRLLLLTFLSFNALAVDLSQNGTYNCSSSVTSEIRIEGAMPTSSINFILALNDDGLSLKGSVVPTFYPKNNSRYLIKANTNSIWAATQGSSFHLSNFTKDVQPHLKFSLHFLMFTGIQNPEPIAQTYIGTCEIAKI